MMASQGEIFGHGTRGAIDVGWRRARAEVSREKNQRARQIDLLACEHPAAAIIGAAYIVPTIRSELGPNELDRPGWIVIGPSLHVFGHVLIRFGYRAVGLTCR